jgi:hypothetical protein
MPRGQRKHGEFDFTIWFEDGARIQWKSTRSQTDKDIAEAIRTYLFPLVESIESPVSADAVDPSAANPGTLPTREKSS